MESRQDMINTLPKDNKVLANQRGDLVYLQNVVCPGRLETRD